MSGAEILPAAALDRYLVAQVAASGVEPDAAADMVARATEAMLARLREGRTVTLPGVGRLSTRTKDKDTFCDGPGRVEVVVVCLKSPAELSRGERRRSA